MWIRWVADFGSAEGMAVMVQCSVMPCGNQCWGASANNTSGRPLSLFLFQTAITIHVLSLSSSISPSLLHPAGVEKVTTLSTTLQGLLIFSMPVAALDYWALPGRAYAQTHKHTPCPSLVDPAKPQHYSLDLHHSLHLHYTHRHTLTSPRRTRCDLEICVNAVRGCSYGSFEFEPGSRIFPIPFSPVHLCLSYCAYK